MKVSITSNGNMRRYSNLKLLLPIIIGVTVGLLFSWFNESKNDISCNVSVVYKTKRKQNSPHGKHIQPSVKVPIPIKPKANHFNYDLRPYFVYSELGFHYQILVAVQTSESNLLNYAIAINNTYLQEFSNVVFFTPYSKKEDFHEKFNVLLNLNVVQLPDIIEGESSAIEFSSRVLQYMKDHYVNSYNWFMLVPDNTYVNADKLKQFLHSFNSSEDVYLGHSIYKPGNHPNEKPLYYCHEKAGVIVSGSTLLKLSVDHSKYNDFSIALAKSIKKVANIDCMFGDELEDLFIVKRKENLVIKAEEKERLLTIWPASPEQILELHKYYMMQKLQQSFKSIHKLQNDIRSLQIKLPQDVPEKILSWPIGIPKSFKPSTRFEVIQWTYFTFENLYGHSDTSPVSGYPPSYKRDLNEIMNVIKKYSKSSGDIHLRNGYRRLDPQRGAEYILDIGQSKSSVERVHLLRPLSKVEALPMPAATEQKGIHLVLPVLREDIPQYETFLQIYKRVCLQTGENVVLLTVFINVRDEKFQSGDKEDSFRESKELIARYKRSYMWAQLPWLQVGVKRPARLLIMDIVSMKLPSNALIFLLTHSTEFTTNFLNRCRVNAVNGLQVFFPIPFAEYDPNIVYENRQKPTFVDVHRDNGYWDYEFNKLGCFNNNDYKQLRMHNNNFLDENIPVSAKVYDVFYQSNLQMFRAVDSELRSRHIESRCDDVKMKNCSDSVAKRKGSRAQLAKYLFQKEAKNMNRKAVKS